MYYMEQVQALCRYEQKWVTEDCAKAKYHTLSSKLTIHWDIKALVFLVTDDLDRCFFLHSSPVSNNSSSGLASLCPGSEHHLLTSSDISFQTVLSHEFSAHLSCSCQEVSMSSSNPCLDALLLALFFVLFCIWTCSVVSALLSPQVSVLSSSSHLVSFWKSSHRLQLVEGHPFADLTGLQHWQWPLALVQSGVWLWQHNQAASFHTILRKQSDCTIAKTCLGWTFS